LRKILRGCIGARHPKLQNGSILLLIQNLHLVVVTNTSFMICAASIVPAATDTNPTANLSGSPAPSSRRKNSPTGFAAATRRDPLRIASSASPRFSAAVPAPALLA